MVNTFKWIWVWCDKNRQEKNEIIAKRMTANSTTQRRPDLESGSTII